jgi:Ca2+-binding RTX toxin-like protein
LLQKSIIAINTLDAFTDFHEEKDMATRNGTPGNDTLTGSASADSLFGLAGDDSLLGLASDEMTGSLVELVTTPSEAIRVMTA